ncbi:hypothetical protein EBT25_07275 [bacterium]|jgi:DNA repair exonuclease SbcCD ATPase subunit|nr:hypothetical protein [bacterium]
METEFVNIFIEKQREMINDLVARNIMLEARTGVAELKTQKVAELEQNVNFLRDELTKKSEEVRQLAEQNKLISTLEEQVKTLSTQLTQTDADLVEARKQINTLVVERESVKTKLEGVKKRAKTLIGDE